MTVTVWLVVGEVALENSAVSEEQLTKARTSVHNPVTLVVLLAHISSTISDFTVTISFTSDELSDVLCSIVISACALPHNLTILEHTSILASITHQEDTLTRLRSVDERALVLEVGIRVSVGSLSVSQFRNWVDVADIPILRHLKLKITLLEVDALSLMLLLVLADVRVGHTDRVSMTSIV